MQASAIDRNTGLLILSFLCSKVLFDLFVV
jgi:hypothetical protein